MHKKRKILLFKALKNNGKISVRTANRLYSGNGGKDALIAMEFEGFLENKGFGKFQVKKVPHDVEERFKDWKESSEESEPEDDKSYSKEAVA